MKRAIAKAIVKYRIVILIVLLLAAVWSVPQISRTRINYDLTRYLSDSTMTKRALKVMNEEFGSTEQLYVMFADKSDEEIARFTDQLQGMEEIRFVQSDPSADTKEKDGITYRRLTLTLHECDATRPRLSQSSVPSSPTRVNTGSAAPLPSIWMSSAASARKFRGL